MNQDTIPVAAPSDLAPFILSAVPPISVLTAATADRIKPWGRTAVDATLPNLTPAADERTVRFALQALNETFLAHGAIYDEGHEGWSSVAEAVREADSYARRTAFRGEEGTRALKLYVGLRFLELARSVWSEKLECPLPAGR